MKLNTTLLIHTVTIVFLLNKKSNAFLNTAPVEKQTTKAITSTVTRDTTTIGNKLVVPNVGVGTIAWSSDSGNYLANSELQSLVNTAHKSNAAFFDTAERYGTNFKTQFGFGWGDTEKLLGKLASRVTDSSEKKNLPVIASKFTPSPWRTTVKSVVDACKESRDRLGVEQIDLYQINMPDIVQPLKFLGHGDSKDEIYWDGLAECYHQGLVSNVGVCNYGPTLVRRCQEHLAKRGVPLASNQIAYSLIGRKYGAQDTLDICNQNGIKVLACYPLAMGVLTGKFMSKSEEQSTASSLLTTQKTKLEIKDLNQCAKGDGMKNLYQSLGNIAKRRRKTVAQVALNYIICKGALPIPGARTEEQVADNIGAMGWRLTPIEVAMLEHDADALDYGFEGAGFKRTSGKFVGYGVEKWMLD